MAGIARTVSRAAAGVGGVLLTALPFAGDIAGLGTGGSVPALVSCLVIGSMMILYAILGRRFAVVFTTLAILATSLLMLAAGLDLVSAGLLASGLLPGPEPDEGLMDFRTGVAPSFHPVTGWRQARADSVAGAGLILAGGSEVALCGNEGALMAGLLASGAGSSFGPAADLSAPFFNSMQSLAGLVLALRDGARPGMVVLVTGPGDVLCCYENGDPAIPCGTWAIERAFASSREEILPWLPAGSSGIMGFLRGTSVQDLARRLIPELAGPSNAVYTPFCAPKTTPPDPGLAGARIIRRLEAEREIMDALASAFQFDYRLVWLAAGEPADSAGAEPLYVFQDAVDSLVTGYSDSLGFPLVIRYERSGAPWEGASGFSGISGPSAESMTRALGGMITGIR
jgi:hypothetical protein